MRTIIYGAGGIGGGIGGHLALAGYDVILISRSGHAKAINEQGLKLITPDGTHIIRAPAVTSPDQITFKPEMPCSFRSKRKTPSKPSLA